MEWRWKKFDELTVHELYQAIQLRERVFAVGQNCVYLDCDGADLKAWHLLGYKDQLLVAYLRAFPVKIKYQEASIGRVVTAPEARHEGHGKALINKALQSMEATFGKTPIRISAQAHLEKFYNSFEFTKVSAEYLEDNIPHIEMVRD